jgi:FKBP-type peptidyl-prolyl cis-trans isomerase
MTRLSLAALLLATACGSTPAREATAPAPIVEAAPAPAPSPAPAPAKTEGDPPLPVAAPPADAVRTTTGVAYKILVEGSGASPGPNDTVATRGAGWYPDGELLFEARDPDDTPSGPLWALPEELRVAIAVLKPGGRGMFWIPADIAGNDKGRVFDLELVSVTPAPPPPADVAAPPKGARAIGNGIRVARVARGNAAAKKPRPGESVKIQLRGWDRTGRSFGGNPLELPMSALKIALPGVHQVVTGMAAGEKVHAWIPGPLAASLDEAIEGDALFAIELTEVVPAPAGTPAVPADVAAPPRRAKRTAKGVAYRVLTKGTGTAKPTEASTVTVHYTGWTTDGGMFDSSVTRGTPASFPLQAVIPGWRDAVQTMVVGEKTRFWIPAELAYGATPRAGAPAGMLVFDIELVSIDEAP